MQYESAVFRCGKPRFAVYWFRAVLLTSIPSRLCYSTSTYRSREIQKEERFPPNRRCGSVETCRKPCCFDNREKAYAEAAARSCIAEAAGLRFTIMAEVILKNVRKVYPNTESKKKKKKDEAVEKKNNLEITDEGVVAVQDFNIDVADKEFIVLVGPSGCGKSTCA